MTRVRQRIVAWLCLGTLLFLQLAVAAYACPTAQEGGLLPMATSSVAEACQGMDQERPKLCEQHCIQALQSVDTQPHSTVAAPFLPLIAIVLQPDVHLPSKSGVDQALRVKVVDPPPLVRFGVLRI